MVDNYATNIKKKKKMPKKIIKVVCIIKAHI